MNNVKIKYDEILDILQSEFATIQLSKSEYSDLSFVVADEQMFAKTKDKSPNAIYIVIHFGDATTNMGQAILPVELFVLGQQNKVDLIQSFLSDFVYTYNLNVNSDNTITQLYMTPNRSINFNEVYNGFRTLFNMTGTFVIGDNTIRLSSLQYYYEEEELVDGETVIVEKQEDIIVLSYDDLTENSLNPQPYMNTNGRTKSYGSFQTFAFTILIYADGSKKLCQSLMAWKFDDTRSHQNDTFVFSGTFANSNTNMPKWNFKCRSADFSQKIGEIPAFSATFAL